VSDDPSFLGAYMSPEGRAIRVWARVVLTITVQGPAGSEELTPAERSWFVETVTPRVHEQAIEKLRRQPLATALQWVRRED
jgi:hypothetical protein